VPKRERVNIFTTLTHDFDNGTQFYAEAGAYYAQTNRLMEHPTVLSTARFIIPKENYWNPFGATTLADGLINPNRLSGLDIPDEGVDIFMYRYRAVDAGRRASTVKNKSYRLLAGFNGTSGDWDYDSAILYSKASSDDLTEGGVSSTLFQKALSLNTPDAYNPFNGTGGSTSVDLTPNPQNVIASIQGDVRKYGETTLALVDYKMSNSSIYALPSGDVGFAAGVEARRETFLDDRGPRLDGTMPFIDSVSGAFSQSDALGNSPTNDSNGSRNVYSAFAELLLPVISQDMNIPLINSVNVQLATRYENFSDVGNIIKPRIAVAWGVTEDLNIRSSFSSGFRAPNLIQLNDTGLSRINTVIDYNRCQALVAKGELTNENECQRGSMERFSAGNEELKSEYTDNLTVGVTYLPSFAPGLVLTVDYWEVKQINLIGLFGNTNYSQLDRFLRNEGSSSENIIREAVTDEDIALYAGSGQEAVGRIRTINDAYSNLNKRTVSGVDLSAHYNFDTDDLGSFSVKFDSARLQKFEQEAGSDGQRLIDNGIAVTGLGDLREQNGKPDWRHSARFLWTKGNWGAGLFGRYVGAFNDTSARMTVDGETVYWRVKSHLEVNGTLDYQFRKGVLDDARVRLGVKNIFDKLPPLSDDGFGYATKLHSLQGRYVYLDLRYDF